MTVSLDSGVSSRVKRIFLKESERNSATTLTGINPAMPCVLSFLIRLEQHRSNPCFYRITIIPMAWLYPQVAEGGVEPNLSQRYERYEMPFLYSASFKRATCSQYYSRLLFVFGSLFWKIFFLWH